MDMGMGMDMGGMAVMSCDVIEAMVRCAGPTRWGGGEGDEGRIGDGDASWLGSCRAYTNVRCRRKVAVVAVMQRGGSYPPS